MNIVKLYEDFSIDAKTEGHKHCRPGWINVECPWCSSGGGHSGYHLGFNISGNIFVCWRCGVHQIAPTIGQLLNVSDKEAYQITKQYGELIPKSRQAVAPLVRMKAHKLPSGIGPLLDHHKKYLQRRKFNSDKLEHDWHLMSTGPISRLDKLDYSHRIIIPFIWEGKQVSFDSRDVTGHHISKYMACSSERELIPHKSILYGKQEAWGDQIIIVEGPTDVWRFGDQSAATSGIKYTPKQVRVIASLFKRAPVCFDGGEPQALIAAKALVADLKFRGCDSFLVSILGDPGGMIQTEANALVKSILNR